MTLAPLSKRVVYEAKCAIGYSAAPANLAVFAHWLETSGEKPGVGVQMATYRRVDPKTGAVTISSTCGLGVRAIWYRAGVDDPASLAPYVLQTAIDARIAFAKKHSAYVDMSHGGTAIGGIAEGDMLYLGDGGDGHVDIVIEILPNGDVLTVDAGQLDFGGHQLVGRKRHTFSRRRDGRWWSSCRFDPAGQGLEGHERPLNGYIKTALLPSVSEAEYLRRHGLSATDTPPLLVTTDPEIRGFQSGVLEGFDISGHNTIIEAGRRVSAIDWKAFDAQTGGAIQFCVVKAGEGSSLIPPYEDGWCHDHCAGARSVGLDLTVYHYLKVRPGRAQDGAQQAVDCFRVWEREKCTFTAWLDSELQGNEKATKQEVWEAEEQFVNKFKELSGKKPTLYTFPAYRTGVLLEPGNSHGCDLAIADYGPARAIGEPWVPAPWAVWEFHQYAADAGRIGKLPGIKGNVDRSIFRGTQADLRSLGG